MLLIDRSQVESLLDLDELIDALEVAMTDLSAGRASVPDRIGAMVDEREAMLAAMPGYVPSLGALVTKLVTLFPTNAGSELPTHQALIACFDPQTGKPTALIDGTYITATRTGAGSALSARLLAREDSAVLTILGTGVQARSHARAMCRVRSIEEIRVTGRDGAKAAQLADELSAALGTATRAVGSPEAFEGADIVCATTHSPDPVVRREWLEPGTHVTSVGYNPNGRELDDDTLRDARLFVESRRAVLAPIPAGSHDLIDPLEAGVITADRIAELGEVISGKAPGRADADEITVYKSVGVAVQDAAAAALVLRAALERGIGREIEL